MQTHSIHFVPLLTMLYKEQGQVLFPVLHYVPVTKISAGGGMWHARAALTLTLHEILDYFPPHRVVAGWSAPQTSSS